MSSKTSTKHFFNLFHHIKVFSLKFSYHNDRNEEFGLKLIMGTIISKDTRRVSFNNTISVNPVLIHKAISDNDELTVEDFDEIQSNKVNYKDSTDIIRMHNEEKDYWAQRVDHLKNEHQIINNIIESEYKISIEKANTLFETQNITNERIQKLKPCLDWRSRIVRCYEENPRQPLVCSAVVQAFNECVTSCRLEN